MLVVVLMDIAAACNKPKWLAFITIVPLINSLGWPFYWGYLAFSKMPESAETPVERIPEARPEPPKPEVAKAEVPKPAESLKPAASQEKPAEEKPAPK